MCGGLLDLPQDAPSSQIVLQPLGGINVPLHVERLHDAYGNRTEPYHVLLAAPERLPATVSRKTTLGDRIRLDLVLVENQELCELYPRRRQV